MIADAAGRLLAVKPDEDPLGILDKFSGFVYASQGVMRLKEISILKKALEE